jgi:ATP-dependent DNA ligase
MSILDILDDLEADNSRLAKLAVLKQNKNNNLLKKVFVKALDPMVKYHVRKIPKYAHVAENLTLDEAIDGLNILTTRQKTGNEAIAHFKHLLENVSEDDAVVLERIIKKDLRCGVSAKTVNAVWPKLIFEWPVMLAAAKGEVKYPAYAQVKMDGMRANILVENGEVTVFSRAGRPIELFGAMDEEALKISEHFAGPIVLDGEFIMMDNGEALNRKTGNGILNKAIKGTISEREAQMAVMIVWDVIPLQDFKKGKSKVPYSERFENLKAALTPVDEVERFSMTLAGNPNKFILIESIMINSPNETEELYNKALSEGKEGLVLKDAGSPWENKRSKFHIKMKAENVKELRVIGWTEGTGKYVGKLGSLICSSECGGLVVNVGSGLTDELREQYTAEEIVGKIISVLYNEKIESKGRETASLFLPRFIEVREDKDTADHAKDF